MKKAVYAGSFNPFHAGHLHVLREALKVFDEVVVLVAINPEKRRPSDEDLKARLVHIVKAMPIDLLARVRVHFTDGYVVDWCAQNGAAFLIRGIRGAEDLEPERALQEANFKLRPSITTFFVLAPPELVGVSSTLIRNENRCPSCRSTENHTLACPDNWHH